MQTTISKQNRNENKITKIIDKVLNQIFGEEATNLIYQYLEKNYALKREEIGDKVEVFATGLENFLKSGAYVIEQKILEDIYASYGLLRRLELERTREECNFISQIKSISRKM